MKTAKEILDFLEDVDRNFYNQTGYEVVNRIRIALVQLSNINFYEKAKHSENVDVIDKVNDLLKKYLKG